MVALNKKIVDLLNYRIKEEEKGCRLYSSMSCYLGYEGYYGASKLWKCYAEEEKEHAYWVYDYLKDLGHMIELQTIDKPESRFEGLIDIVEKTHKIEMDVITQCQALAKTCATEGDYMTLHLAQKFLDEQVEEVGKAHYWIGRLEAFGDDTAALRKLDWEMEKKAEHYEKMKEAKAMYKSKY